MLCGCRTALVSRRFFGSGSDRSGAIRRVRKPGTSGKLGDQKRATKKQKRLQAVQAVWPLHPALPTPPAFTAHDMNRAHQALVTNKYCRTLRVYDPDELPGTPLPPPRCCVMLRDAACYYLASKNSADPTHSTTHCMFPMQTTPQSTASSSSSGGRTLASPRCLTRFGGRRGSLHARRPLDARSPSTCTRHPRCAPELRVLGVLGFGSACHFARCCALSSYEVTCRLCFLSPQVPEMRVLDVPGYGFARAPKAVVRNWHADLEHYLCGRGQELLGRVCVPLPCAPFFSRSPHLCSRRFPPRLRYMLIDVRRGVTAKDREVLDILAASTATYQVRKAAACRSPLSLSTRC